jgi:hypothetical protein
MGCIDGLFNNPKEVILRTTVAFENFSGPVVSVLEEAMPKPDLTLIDHWQPAL